MKQLVATAWMVMVGVMSLGCGTAPDRQYYALSYTLVDVPKEAKARFDVNVRVVEPDVRLAYDRPQIVYRYDPFRFKYYHYRFWVAKPQQMLAELVHRHLLHTNLFRETTLVYQSQVPDYELQGEIEAIEEYDSGDVWYAHLAMSLRLVRFSDRRIVWAYRFDKKKEVPNKQPVYVVRAMSDILEEEMSIITHGMAQAMESEMRTPSRGTGGSQ
jgi:ABC-type uncharacterized transport system auxiliary subunit